MLYLDVLFERADAALRVVDAPFRFLWIVGPSFVMAKDCNNQNTLSVRIHNAHAQEGQYLNHVVAPPDVFQRFASCGPET